MRIPISRRGGLRAATTACVGDVPNPLVRGVDPPGRRTTRETSQRNPGLPHCSRYRTDHLPRSFSTGSVKNLRETILHTISMLGISAAFYRFAQTLCNGPPPISAHPDSEFELNLSPAGAEVHVRLQCSWGLERGRRTRSNKHFKNNYLRINPAPAPSTESCDSCPEDCCPQ
jgi:hypothetical protein